MAYVVFDNVSKAFGPTAALRQISFEAAEGEFLVIVGPSGCGKSTLLRLVAGLETPDGGRIFLDGVDMTGKPPKQRGVAMVFQSYALYPHWTVFENLAFPLKIKGASRESLRQKVNAIADSLQLSTQLSKRPKELSGGQRQRVALGRAMAADPKIFLFDEPLSNLDAPLRAEMRREIATRQKSLGKTSLYVTHDQTEALTMADRIVVLDAGNIMGMGRPEELYDNPPNRFVAQFLGRPAVNIINVQPVFEDGRTMAPPLGWNLSATGTRTSIPTGRNVLLGIRPEHIKISAANSASPWRIASREFLGDKIQYSIETGGISLNILTDAHSPLDVGQSAALEPDSKRMLFFDPVDGRRLR